MKKIIISLFILGLGAFLFITFSQQKKTVETKKEEKETVLTETELEIKNSIFQETFEEAKEIVDQMTLEEKIGQLFLVRYDKNMVSKYASYHPGGYILFAKDFQNHTKESFKKELERNQSLHRYSLIYAVDEEGGYVTRVSRFPAFRKEKFSSPKTYYEKGGYPLLEETEKEKALLLKELGIDWNLAPVADLSTNPEDFIYIRTFGKEKEEVKELISHMVTYANQNKIASCLKHFPGYGNNKDTHTGSAIDNRSYENFVENDFIPFIGGIEANVPSILVSHNKVMSMDENLPASLSPKVIGELRNTLHFTGIILTDDLDMAAVKEYTEKSEAVTLAIHAGNDMIITSDFIPMVEEIKSAVEKKIIKEETIDQAVLRIMAFKKMYQEE